MKSAISEMKKSKNKAVYLKMWGDWIIPDGDFKIGKTVAEGNGEGSNVSYSFIIEGDQKNGLADIFGVQNKELFGIKFDEAISGSGKEQKKITTLHSSSLCSLLIFYNVSVRSFAIKRCLEQTTSINKVIIYTTTLRIGSMSTNKN